MDRAEVAVTIALEYLADRLSPLEAASRMGSLDIAWLPCWERTGGAQGPLLAFYEAADAAEKCHFLGEDVERWAPQVREQKRSELLSAEDQWREPIAHACRALLASSKSRGYGASAFN
jgi:hypothetical protein